MKKKNVLALGWRKKAVGGTHSGKGNPAKIYALLKAMIEIGEAKFKIKL